MVMVAVSLCDTGVNFGAEISRLEGGLTKQEKGGAGT
jgi:hypothetical protein